MGTPVVVSYSAQLVTQEYIYNTVVLTHPLAIQSAGATSSPAEAWGSPEIVDSARRFDENLGSGRHIAVDSLGRVHVAYAGDGLYYGVFSGTTWTSERVPVTPTSVWAAALVLDDQNLARIAFHDAGHVWVARQVSSTEGVSWSLESIAAVSAWSGSMSLDLQPARDGRLHLAYSYEGDLYYTVYSGSTCLSPTQVITGGACSLFWTSDGGFSLALDENDVPHVACALQLTTSLYDQFELRLYTGTVGAPGRATRWSTRAPPLPTSTSTRVWPTTATPLTCRSCGPETACTTR